MSCDSALRAAAMHFGDQIAPALGLAAAQAATALQEIWELAQARAEARVVPTETDQTAAGRQIRLQVRAGDAVAREATIASFQAMAALDPPIPAPSHGDPDLTLGFALPKLANQHGWRAVWETVEAARAGGPLPNLAREVIAARRGTTVPPLPDLLPNLPPPLGVAGFAEHAAISGPGTPLGAAFGSPEAAAEVLGRVWAAELRRPWSHYILNSDTDRQIRADASALLDRLRNAGVTPPAFPLDSAQDMDAFRQRSAYAAVERVLAAIERGNAPEQAMPVHIVECGMLPTLSADDRQALDLVRAGTDPVKQAMALTRAARRLQAGRERDTLVREALIAALTITSGKQRRDVLDHVGASIPSPAELDNLIALAATQRQVTSAREALDALVPFLDADGLTRWEQQSMSVRDGKIREALDAAVARERMYRAPHSGSTCTMCGRWRGLTEAHLHACPGPSRARLRSLAIATQVRRAIAQAVAETPSLLAEANARLDQIAESLPPADPIRGLIARDRAWITAPLGQKAP
jgi:hypothetical protein